MRWAGDKAVHSTGKSNDLTNRGAGPELSGDAGEGN